MAKIKQGILGGFSGKVAGVVGTSWKGRAVMKSLPLSVANPRTEGQVSQRTSFAGIAVLASVLLTWIVRTVYNPIAGNISGYNLFCKQNKLAYDANGDFDFAAARIGGGTLLHDQLHTMTLGGDKTEIEVEWINTAPALSPRLTDTVHSYVIEPVSGNVYVNTADAIRSAEIVTCNEILNNETLSGVKTCYGFIAYVSADGRQVSIAAGGFSGDVDFGA